LLWANDVQPEKITNQCRRIFALDLNAYGRCNQPLPGFLQAGIDDLLM
jgi:hypothetical protein